MHKTERQIAYSFDFTLQLYYSADEGPFVISSYHMFT